MDDTSKLEIRLLNGISISLPLNDYIQRIRGNSGVGKSYVCSIIKLAQNHSEYIEYCSMDINDIIIVDSIRNIPNNIDHKVIIIDRFGFLIKHDRDNKLRNLILESNNKFILIDQSYILNGIPLKVMNDYVLVSDKENKIFTTHVYRHTERGKDPLKIFKSQEEIDKKYLGVI